MIYVFPAFVGMLDMLLDTELETAQRDYAQTAQVYINIPN